MAFEDKIKELMAKREQAKLGGGEKRINAQHAKGKHIARERIEMLLDEEHRAEGGHGGAADNEQRAFMSSLAYTFLWKELAEVGP